MAHRPEDSGGTRGGRVDNLVERVTRVPVQRGSAVVAIGRRQSLRGDGPLDDG